MTDANDKCGDLALGDLLFDQKKMLKQVYKFICLKMEDSIVFCSCRLKQIKEGDAQKLYNCLPEI